MSSPGQAARPRFGLIADDLTGACDASVQFAARGFCTAVCIDSSPHAFGSFDLVALNTSSRNDTDSLAAQKVRGACGALLEQQREIIFKKIDSTLRGKLCSEIVATMQTCGFTLALLAPAYPAMGRVVEAGELRVVLPAGKSSVNVAALLQEQGAERVVSFGPEAWGQDPESLSTKLKSLPDGTIATLGSIWDFDLEHIARAGLLLRGRALLVGSAGLAAATAKVVSEEYRLAPSLTSAPTARETSPRSVIFLMGSTHSVTQAQIEFLVRQENTIQIKLDANARGEALEGLKTGQPMLVTIEPGCADDPRLKDLLSILSPSSNSGIALSGGD
ncbi:MAG: four-carbon acid sugar kinase family protein, partial [Deltaproteobacteria bacterium]